VIRAFGAHGQAVDILEVVSQSIPILIRLFPATSGSFAKPASGRRIPIVGPPASADVRQRLHASHYRESVLIRSAAEAKIREADRLEC
jgi:hypothetical protein